MTVRSKQAGWPVIQGKDLAVTFGIALDIALAKARSERGDSRHFETIELLKQDARVSDYVDSVSVPGITCLETWREAGATVQVVNSVQELSQCLDNAHGWIHISHGTEEWIQVGDDIVTMDEVCELATDHAIALIDARTCSGGKFLVPVRDRTGLFIMGSADVIPVHAWLVIYTAIAYDMIKSGEHFLLVNQAILRLVWDKVRIMNIENELAEIVLNNFGLKVLGRPGTPANVGSIFELSGDKALPILHAPANIVGDLSEYSEEGDLTYGSELKVQVKVKGASPIPNSFLGELSSGIHIEVQSGKAVHISYKGSLIHEAQSIDAIRKWSLDELRKREESGPWFVVTKVFMVDHAFIFASVSGKTSVDIAADFDIGPSDPISLASVDAGWNLVSVSGGAISRTLPAAKSLKKQTLFVDGYLVKRTPFGKVKLAGDDPLVWTEMSKADSEVMEALLEW